MITQICQRFQWYSDIARLSPRLPDTALVA